MIFAHSVIHEPLGPHLPNRLLSSPLPKMHGSTARNITTAGNATQRYATPERTSIFKIAVPSASLIIAFSA